MQEPHQVAPKLMSSMCFAGFVRRVFRSEALAISSFIGCSSIFRSDSRRETSFSCHLVEQRVDRIAGGLRVYEFLAIAIVHAAFVAQLSILIENEDVRGGLRTVCTG